MGQCGGYSKELAEEILELAQTSQTKGMWSCEPYIRRSATDTKGLYGDGITEVEIEQNSGRKEGGLTAAIVQGGDVP